MEAAECPHCYRLQQRHLRHPRSRPFIQQIWYINQGRLDEIGAGQPKSADDFKRLLQQLTRPQANQYGIGGILPTSSA